jgi:predicted phage replisome organizer
MSKYDNTKFYWLQLKEDFFEDDSIQWLEEQQPNGRDYAYFYLKLCLKSLKSNGVLIRKVGNILIPYDNKKLAELTKMDFDTVTVAMELLKQIGLVTVLETGEIYVNQLENLIGSKSIGAFKKQQQRLLGGQTEDKCPPKIEIELEKEIDIDNNKKFKRPTLEEVEAYCKQRNSSVDAKTFYEYFETGGWVDSKGNKVKNWKQKIITWEKSRKPSQKEETIPDWFNKDLGKGGFDDDGEDF